MSTPRCPFYRVLIQQGASHVDVLLTDKDEQHVVELIRRGRPFQVWVQRAGAAVESLSVAPAVGHMRHVSSAAPTVPLNGQGRPAQQGEQVVTHLSAFEHTEQYGRMFGLARVVETEGDDLADALTRLASAVAAMTPQQREG